MQLRLKDIVRQLEQIAPPEYAASWDNTGLQIGGSFDRIHSILVALDITHGVIHEAVKKKVDLIITHHPLFFRPIKRIRTDSGTGRLVQRLLREEITVYAAHTNLDVVQDGVNDILGKAMGLEEWSLIQDVTLPEGTGWGRVSALKD
jgi:dinuclear metal center YbgI/SA1388 family protein